MKIENKYSSSQDFQNLFKKEEQDRHCEIQVAIYNRTISGAEPYHKRRRTEATAESNRTNRTNRAVLVEPTVQNHRLYNFYFNVNY
ncbi:hypothetical protein BpHYR1_035583 [Brachionus plicatilis]|uniref:Uncharacterized protein n=1 Tax=Brachionus plicatilis TaxID=10195 RepID=A0A3M7RA00_BRAPC|nr:hypothetical protein BpHYR1_035583 [Brachionus plicatilis]